ncbi:MAG: 6-phosphogluconolactonase [Peptostreptococcaceae bacterium]
MRLIKTNDYKELSILLASEISGYLQQDDKLVCLPSGDTPVGAYNILVDEFKDDKDKIACKFVGLDEWVGMDKNTSGSCQQYLDSYLFGPLDIGGDNLIEFDATSDDLSYELEKMDGFIKSNGNLDLVVLGVGMNGHLGLNEPNTCIDTYSHIVDLDSKTIEVAQKYFDKDQELSKGITLGLKHFLEAKKLVLIISGEKKKHILKEILESDVTTSIPATICKLHHNCVILADEDSLSIVNQELLNE